MRNKCIVSNCKKRGYFSGNIKENEIEQFVSNLTSSNTNIYNIKKKSNKNHSFYSIYSCKKHATQVELSIALLTYFHFKQPYNLSITQ